MTVSQKGELESVSTDAPAFTSGHRSPLERHQQISVSEWHVLRATLFSTEEIVTIIQKRWTF